MKIILLAICTITLLASAGCVFRGGHDHADVREHRHYGDNDGPPNGVDHRERPGDRDHDANR